MAEGTVKMFNVSKGFGFIEPENGKDIFVHVSKITKGIILKDGDRVIFDVRQGNKGPEALNVKLAGTVSSPNPSLFNKTQIPGPGTFSQPSGKATFPYGFVSRKGGKGKTEAMHDRLNEDRIDVAFEVTWTTRTPTALAPCEDVGLPASAVNRDGENIGYNKRWLTIDHHLAISPFTVKGAVANAFANLRGGCFRVVDRVEGHKTNANAEGFPYTGKWKRYRVAMNKSYPGIIEEIDPVSGYVKVQPVKEFYFDSPNLPFSLARGATCSGTAKHEKNKNFIQNLTQSTSVPGSKAEPLTYYGPYRFGMDLTLRPGEMNKKHYHRFYQTKDQVIDGTIPKLNFATQEDMLKNSYGGVFCKGEKSTLAQTGNPKAELLGQPWYQNLREMKPGDWCYYTTFNDDQGQVRITGIGKNFQFKTFFSHQETVPDGNKACVSIDTLCPRCSLFGATEESSKEQKAVGYAGRFRASALKAEFEIKPRPFMTTIPSSQAEQVNKVEFLSWLDNEGDEIVRQVLLPIMGPPKASRRDSDGYYDATTGAIKGAKRYEHGQLDFVGQLPRLISGVDRLSTTEENLPYAHHLRPVAPVCRERVAFHGTLGVENCSDTELATLLSLLDERAADNAFKLGLGKSIGMGSVSSRINKLWVRRTDNYTWKEFVVADTDGRKDLFATIREAFPAVVDELKKIINDKTQVDKVHQLSTSKERLSFGKAGFKYWREAHVETVK